jgi:Ca-activated chloride channel family protein
MRHHRISALVVSLATAALAVVHAQSTAGHIRGVVVDSTGDAMPGVTVSISPVPPGGKRESITDQTGAYAFFAIDPGHYTLTASLAGFRSSTLAAEVKAGDTVRLDFVLSVGSLEETVTVTGQTPRIETYATSSSTRRRDASRPRFNTETYDRIVDNSWMEVARTPLSTFSTDVDTASYANVRRFLKQGQAPPKDAVRIEELINYFPFRYAEPLDDKPIAVTTAVGDCPWNAAHKLALIGLQARRIDASHVPPRNLVFLIDVSGSMNEPNKLSPTSPTTIASRSSSTRAARGWSCRRRKAATRRPFSTRSNVSGPVARPMAARVCNSRTKSRRTISSRAA